MRRRRYDVTEMYALNAAASAKRAKIDQLKKTKGFSDMSLPEVDIARPSNPIRSSRPTAVTGVQIPQGTPPYAKASSGMPPKRRIRRVSTEALAKVDCVKAHRSFLCPTAQYKNQ